MLLYVYNNILFIIIYIYYNDVSLLTNVARAKSNDPDGFLISTLKIIFIKFYVYICIHIRVG